MLCRGVHDHDLRAGRTSNRCSVAAKHLLPRLGRGEVMFVYALLAMLTALMIWEGASLAGAALIFGIVLIGLRLRV